MRILLGDKGNVDFDGPLMLGEEKERKFIDFVKGLFAVVEVTHQEAPRTERIGSRHFMRPWSKDELLLLLTTDSTEELIEKLGRSWMSIVIQRGDFLPDFDSWCERNGYERKGDYKELIKKYTESKEFEKRRRKEILRAQSRVQECKDCFLPHNPEVLLIDPEIYDGEEEECYLCGGRLKTLRVTPERKEEIRKRAIQEAVDSKDERRVSALKVVFPESIDFDALDA